MDRRQILSHLTHRSPERADELGRAADRTRRDRVGDMVHLRGLVEISNHCRRSCTYCGIRAERKIRRYRLDDDTITACARLALELGYGTVVLQAGEDPALTSERVAALVRRIKVETGLAITLSLGERDPWDLEAWREAGADRYLLRFETSDEALFRRIHPPLGPDAPTRVALLEALRGLGYQVGTGMLVGLPGQSLDDLASDLLLLANLQPEMIGLGPFVPHPETPLGQAAAGRDVTPDLPTMLRLLALARLLCPDAHIPATTAVSVLFPGEGRRQALSWGANVVMPNLTPAPARRGYEIYPGKAEKAPAPSEFHGALLGELRSIGRCPARGPGHHRDFNRAGGTT